MSLSTDSFSQMHAIFNAQKEAFENAPHPSLQTRLAQLNDLKAMIQIHQSKLIEAIQADFGTRAPTETKLAEILPLIHQIEYIQKNLGAWMQSSQRTLPIQLRPARAMVVYQPLGVVGILAPWNYPILLSLSPLATAIAAGNRVMIKPSEWTPETSGMIRTMLAQAFDESLIAVILGEQTTANAFSKLPFDHLFFTGSTEVGKKVMRNAADHLTPVTLELGGKSPVIITTSTNLHTAAKRIAFGKCFNGGQTCIAPDYALIPDHLVDEFAQEFTTVVKKMYAKSADFTPSAHPHHLNRIEQLLEDAEKKGARVVYTQERSETMRLPPTLVFNPRESCRIMQEEIFGPILCLLSYSGDIKEAASYINSRPRPLALYLFSQREDDIEYITKHTHSGGLCINDTLVHFAVDDLPFGGIGASGMGQYHAREGFLTFSKAKSVFLRKKFSTTDLFLPPWNRLIHKLFFSFFLKR